LWPPLRQMSAFCIAKGCFDVSDTKPFTQVVLACAHGCQDAAPSVTDVFQGVIDHLLGLPQERLGREIAKETPRLNLCN